MAAGVLLVLSVGLTIPAIWGRCRTVQPPQAVDLETAAGIVLGREVAADFPQGGRLLVLLNPPLSGASKDVTHFRLDGLRRGLNSHRFNIVEAGPNLAGRGSSSEDFTLLDADRCFEGAAALGEAEPKPVAIVSLLASLPDLSQPALAGDVPWYGFHANRSEEDIPASLDPRVKGMIVSKFDASVGDTPTEDRSPERLFDWRYRLIAP
jgi:hypothetical protein